MNQSADSTRTLSAALTAEYRHITDDAPQEIKDVVGLLAAGEECAAEKMLAGMLERDPRDAEALHFMGLILSSRGQADKGIELIQQAAEINPSRPLYARSLAWIYEKEKKEVDAAKWYFTAIKLAPENIEPYIKLGRLLINARCWRPVIPLMADVLNRDGSVHQAYVLMGKGFNGIHEYDKAIACFQKALELSPNDLDAILNLCDSLETLGKLDEAQEILGAAIRMYPDKIEPLASLAEIRRFEKGAPIYEMLENARHKKSLSRIDKTKICFILGKLYEQTGDYEQAFRSYAEGNALRDTWQEPFNMEEFVLELQQTARVFDVAFFKARAQFGVCVRKPIFIIGMARSGTSLVEQILASHPRVFGGGELDVIKNITTAYFNRHALGSDVTAEKIANAAAEYLNFINILSGNAEFVTDKMPYNLLYLWLVYLMFPEAPIIYCTRDAIDTCFSCYTQNFAEGHQFSNTQKRLGVFYRYYEKLMEHWKTVLPARIMKIQYEELVNDPQYHIRLLIDFCGLEWSEQCERFYETDRPVATASRIQVKQKLYKTSVSRWKPFEPWLGTLIETLDRFKNVSLSDPFDPNGLD